MPYQGLSVGLCFGKVATQQWTVSEPMNDFQLCCMATLFMSKESSGWGKRLADSKGLVTLPIWLLRVSLLRLLSVSIYTDTNISSLGVHLGVGGLTFSPDLLVTNFLTMFFPNSWPSSQTISHCPSVPLIIFPYRHNLQPCMLLEILSYGRIYLHACPSGPPLSEANIYMEFPIGHTLNFTSWDLLGLDFDQ